MWEVYEHRRVAKGLKELPIQILKRYEKWKDIVRITGPEGLKQIRGFNDEALRGEWKGRLLKWISRNIAKLKRLSMCQLVNLGALSGNFKN